MSPPSRHVVLCTLAVLAVAPGTAVAADLAKPVKLRLSEYRIRVDRAHATRGYVVFDLRNTGKLQHEFVIVKTARKANALPVVNGEVSRHGWKGVLPLDPGEHQRVVFNSLHGGHYVLICAIAGHYQKGMRRDFTVR
jgi:uncharacterized cupredoxin-like copper-binding protein